MANSFCILKISRIFNPIYFSNIPNDVSKDFLLNILKNKFNKSKEIFQKIYKILNIEDIPSHVLIKNLSDGQKQKFRFLSFLL